MPPSRFRRTVAEAAALVLVAAAPALVAWQRVPPGRYLARPAVAGGVSAPTSPESGVPDATAAEDEDFPASADPVEAREIITLAQSRAMGGDVLWVDARSAAEFERGTIPGAVPLNEDAWDTLLPGFIAAWQPTRRIMVFCSASCASSRRVAVKLRMQGLERVQVLKGGWEAWQKSSAPAAAK